MKKTGRVLNEMKVVLPAISANESICRALVGAFVAQLNPTIEQLADIKCAVSEAVTNCIVHAYRSDKSSSDADYGDIYISVTCYCDRRVKITVRDEGCGIPDIEAARAPLFTTDTAGERSGMGFAVMENFCDKLSVASRVGHGTKITLVKYLLR